MQFSSTRLNVLRATDWRAYLAAFGCIAGNILLPQVCHQIPQGGLIWLPIYFFTLLGAYRFGLFVGLLTAIASPVVNHLLFGMPGAAMLPAILFKSVSLALVAALVASKAKKAGLLALLLVIVGYQGIGMIAEWAMTGSFAIALQDVRLGFPGLLLQLFGGWIVLNLLSRR